MPSDVTDPAAHIWASIVIFKPDIERLTNLITRLLAQVEGVLIIDNSPEAPPDLRRLMGPGDTRVRYVPMPGNIGVAAGHNRGANIARDLGADFIILFDQDSLPAPDMVTRLLEAHWTLESQNLSIGGIGPHFHDPRDGAEYPFIRLNGWRIQRVTAPDFDQVCRADYLITSGCLISLRTWETVGGLDEGFFIDYVDIEWGLRAKALGYQSFGAFDARMEHPLGDAPIRLFGGRFRAPLHSPLRHYYHFRNAIQLYRRHYAPWRWSINDGLRLLLKLGFYSLFAPQRLEHARMIAEGIRDGVRGYSGQRKPHLQTADPASSLKPSRHD